MEQDDILLKVEGLSQNFGKTRAVKDVSFCLRRGEVFGLVGESGCGKTTTGRAIMGLYPISGGRIFFDGRQIAGDGIRRKRGDTPGMQMIFQDPMASLDPRMTVGQSIAEGLAIRGQRDRQALQEKVGQMLELVGLRREHAGRYPHEFSGGQRQRIGIARAVILQPRLLIADEPLSALDVSVQAQVLQVLEDLREKMGLTVLLIAHDLAVVKQVSHRIGVMHRGRLVEMAEAEELFRCPLHPYTRSLLSAIPIADPVAEKKRRRILYTPPEEEDGQMRQIKPGHWVFCREGEQPF